MTLSVEKIEQIQVVNLSGEVVYTMSNTNGQQTSTLTMNSGPVQNPIVTEAVRKTVTDYGETLRKLSNE